MSLSAGNGGVVVDFHAHLGRPDPTAPFFMRHLFDWEGYLERQAEAGIARTVLCYALEDPEGSAEEDRAKARSEHEFLGELIRDHGDRFSALVSIDPFGDETWLEDAREALTDGFAGICLPTSRDGKYLDSPEAQDALALADEHAAFVFLHPSHVPIALERTGDAVLGGWIGRPFDTGICLSRMLLSGTLARYPDIRMLVAHCGGTIPMLLGRLDQVHEVLVRRAAMMRGGGPPGGGPPGDGPPGGGGPPKGLFALPDDEFALKPSLEGGPPSQRLDRLWFDTASYHPAAIHAAIATVGIDKLVLGTDHPPAGDSPLPALAALDEAGLNAAQKEKILFGNAAALLGST